MNKSKSELSTRTKGEVESDINEAIIKLEREYMGRGPKET